MGNSDLITPAVPGSDAWPPCPKCGGHHFKVWKLPSPVILHWVLNPGLAVNELAFGQRIPKVQLICEDCDEPLGARAYVPCPHCNAMIHGRSWGIKHAFGNWLGYVCPQCGKRIPCLWNFTSLLILAITSPIWYLPYRFYFRDRIPAKPVFSAAGPLNSGGPKPIPKRKWFYMGAAWGFFMWLAMALAPAMRLYSSTHHFDWRPVVIGIPVWVIGGAFFGSMMYFWMGRKKNRAGR